MTRDNRHLQRRDILNHARIWSRSEASELGPLNLIIQKHLNLERRILN